MSVGKNNRKIKPILFVLLVLTVILAMSSASAADDIADDAVIADANNIDLEEVSAPAEEVAIDTEQVPAYSVDDATVTEEVEVTSDDIDTNTNSDAAAEASPKQVLASDSGADNLGVGDQDIGIDFTYPTLYGGDVIDFTVTLSDTAAEGTVTVTIIDTSVPEDTAPRTIVYTMTVVSGVAKASAATVTVDDETADYAEVILNPLYRGDWNEDGTAMFPDAVTIQYSGDETYAAKTQEATMTVYPYEAEMSIDGAKIGETYPYGEALGLVNFEVYDPFKMNNPYLEGDFLVVIIPDTVDTDTFDPTRDTDKIIKSATVHIVDGEGSYTFDDIFDEGSYLIGLFYDAEKFLKYSVWEEFDVAAADVGPFVVSSTGIGYATLAQALEVATEGDTITVIKEGTYTGDQNVGLTVAKSVTIAAAGELSVIFDCQETSNFLTIAEGASVTLKDLNIINGKADKGAGVYVQPNAYLSVYDAYFSNNVATTRGGAIYSEGTVFAYRSLFIGNDVTKRDANEGNGGAAIFNNGGDLNILECGFNENLKNYVPRGTDGATGDLIDGVIVSTGNTRIADSSFNANKGCYGGAITLINIPAGAPIIIDGCTFKDNVAYDGAGIYIANVASDYTISNCVFENNVANGTGSPGYTAAGGAICILKGDGAGTITGSNFTNNTSPDGGAVSIENNTFTIDGCNFYNNTGDSGAAVSFSGPARVYTLTLTNSVFKGNSAKKGTGTAGSGAVEITRSNAVIDECVFLENIGSENARNIHHFNVGTVTVTNSVLDVVLSIPASANTDVNYGTTKTVTVYANDGTFNTNNDKTLVVDVNGEELTSSVAVVFVGQLGARFRFTDVGHYDLVVEDVTSNAGNHYYLTNTASASFNIIAPTGPFVVASTGFGYATLAAALAVANPEGDTITVVEAGTYTGEGNIGVTIAQDVIIKAAEGLDVVFDAKGADTQILTIANGNDVYIKGVDFTGVDNTATKYGAIVNHGDLTIDECDFYDNIVNVAPAAGNNGAAAIFNAGNAEKLTILDSSFERNLAKPINPTEELNTGGIAAVSSWSSTPVYVAGCTFEENEARFGGALEFENLNQIDPCVQDCTFINNHAYVGGAINFNDACQYEVVTGCDFINNTIVGPQGAPTTGSMGAAICAGLNLPSVLVVTDSSFVGNKGDNSDGSSGGAIRLANKASATITNCEFVDNTARQGSAISAGTINKDEATVVITACNFTDNTATLAGTLDLGEGITTTIVDSIFSGNVAPVNRNIDNDGVISTMTGNTFDINSTDIKVNDIPYTQDEVINGTFDAGVNVDLTGTTVSLTIAGQPVTATVAEGNTFTTTVTKPNVGSYDVVFEKVTDENNNVYLAKDPVTKTFNVFKAVADVTVTAEAVTYPAQATVVVTSNVTGTYNIRVGNKNYTVTVDETGSGSVVIDQLLAGTYDIDLSADFGDNYEPIVLIPAAQLTVLDQTGPFLVESSGLRYATLADALASTDKVIDTIIILESGTYTGEGNIGLTIDQDRVITPAEGVYATFNANGADTNIFTVANGKTVSLYNLEITGVDNTNTKYGALVNHGRLNVDGCYIHDNIVHVQGTGGSNGAAAIFNAPDATGLAIKNSNISNNKATSPAYPTGGIGAVASWAPVAVMIVDSYFEANTARYGGAIEFENFNQDLPCVENCTFVKNHAYIGAAINFNDGCTYEIVSNCTFIENDVVGPQGAPTTGSMGAAICAGSTVADSVLVVEDSKFIGNIGDGTDGSSGGAIRLADKASGIITNCEFTGNSDRYGSAISAGTIYGDSASLTISKCNFTDNVASISGTVDIGEGIAAHISDSIFSGNTAPENRNIVNRGGIRALSGNTFDVNDTEILVNDIPYTQDEVINGTFDAGVNIPLTGSTVSLTIGGEAVTATVGEGNTFTTTVTKPNVGSYDVVFEKITDSDNNVYLPVNPVEKTFIVFKAVADVTVTAEALTYPAQATVVVTSNVTGTYNIRVGNKNYTVTVDETGSGSVQIDVLEPGTYDIDLSADFGDNYEPIVLIPAAQLTVNDQTGPFVVESTGLGYATLAEALAVAIADDNITVVEAGTYTGEGNIGVTVNKNVTIKAAEGLKVVFDAQNADTNILTIAHENYVILDGLEFTGVDNTNTKYGAIVNHGALMMYDSYVHDNLVHVAGTGGNNGAAALFNAPDARLLIIVDSVFKNNKATSPSYNTGGIGAVASWASTFVVIDSCTFEFNDARYGGAVEFENLNQEPPCVVNCTFANNRAYIGAGINFNDGCQYETVTNCTFIDNFVVGPQGAPTTGSMGAAICAGLNVDNTLVVSDSRFINNTGDGTEGSSGGAIRLADKTSGIITNCEFTGNSDRIGSAISAGTINGDSASLTISKCNFTDNKATITGTVDIDPGIAAHITDCIFSGNTAPQNRNINNEGGIRALSGNTFDVNETEILVNDIPYTEDEVINGTFDAGVNIPLTGSTVSLTIAGEAVTATVTEGNNFTTTVTKPNVGTYEVVFEKVTDSDNNVYLPVNPVVKTFTVSKADPTITIVGDEVTYGETGEITVKTDVPGFYNVTVNGVSTIVNITEEATIQVPVMNAGKYDIVVFVDESENYNAKTETATEAYVVNKTTPVITIEGDTVQYPAEGTVTIKTDIGGTYTITVNGITKEIEVTETTGQATFATMAVGQYDITVNYAGSENYEAAEVVAQNAYIVTIGAPTIVVEAPTIVYGQDAVIAITLTDSDGRGITGTVEVKINGQTKEVAVENGYGTVTVSDLAAGEYPIEASFAGDESSTAVTGTGTLTVNKAQSEILSTDVDEDYGKDAEVKVTLQTESDYLSGTVYASIDGKDPVAITVTDGFGSTTFADLAPGVHTVILTYEGNDNIIGCEKVITVTIDKASPKLNIYPENIYYGDDEAVVIKLTGLEDEGLTALVLVSIIDEEFNNISLYVPVVNGEGIATVSGLTPGDYAVVAEVFESEFYGYMFDVKSFTVYKSEIGYLSVTAADIAYGADAIANVEFYDVYGDGITGTVIVKVDGRDILVNVVDGVGSVAISDLPAGRHNLIVVFEGDNRYGEAYNYSSYLTVDKANNATVTVSAEDVDFGQDVVIVVGIKDVNEEAMDGIVTVTIDGKSYNVAVVDGVGNLAVSGLDVGEYTITAKFIGDNNYGPSEEASTTVKVILAETELTVVIDDITYGDVAVIDVTLVDENDLPVTGTVTVTIDGVAPITIEVIDGVGQAQVAGLAADTYDFTAEYTGASGYGPATATGTFEVAAADDLIVDVTVNEPKSGEPAIVTITVTDSNDNPIDGTATIEIDGRDPIEVQVTGGQGVVSIENLPAGTTVADVIFANPNYEPAIETVVITVGKGTPVVSVTGSTVEYGDPSTVTVTVSYNGLPVDGRVIVTVDWIVDGLTQVITLEEGSGEASFNLSPYVGEGEYAVTATFIGTDELAEVVNDTEKVIVTASTSLDLTVTANEPDFGEDAVITVTATDASGATVPVDKVNVTIDGVTTEYTVAPDGTVNIGKLPAGDNEITVSVDDGVHTPVSENINVTVAPATGVIVDVIVNDPVYGEEAVLTVTVTDADGQPIDGKLTVAMVGMAPIEVQVTGGQAVVSIPDVPVGTSIADIVFANENYEPVETAAIITVGKGTPVVSVTGSTVEYGDPSTVTVTVSYNGLPVDGRVIVTVDWIVDGLTEVITLEEGSGVASFNLSPYVGAGEYAVTATFIGTDNLAEVVNDTEKVTVTASTIMTIDVTANEPDFGEDVILTVTATDESGATVPVEKVNVTIDGVTTEYTVAPDGTVNIGKLPAGETEIEVIVNDGVHTPAGEDITVVVGKAGGAQVAIDVDDYAFNETGQLVITVTDLDGQALDGSLYVEVDGEIYLLGGTITGGEATINLIDLEVGEHVVTVTFENSDYLPAEMTDHFNVTKIGTVITVTGDEVDFEEAATVTVTVTAGENDVNGLAVVNVNGVDYAVTITDGTGHVDIENLPFGEFAITAHFEANEIYDASVYSGDAKVIVHMPGTVTFDLGITDDYSAITVTDAKDANGDDIDGFIQGKLYKDGVLVTPLDMTLLTDGTGSILLPNNLDAGTYTVVIDVTDQTMELTGSDEFSFTIEPISGVQLTINVDDYPVDQVGTLEVTVTDVDGQALDGSLYVEIDGEPYLLDGTTTGGQATINLNDLKVGEHVVKVTFDKANYLPVEMTDHFNVTKVVPVMTLTGSEVEYGNPSTVSIKVVDAQGNPVTGTVIVAVDWIVDGLYDVVELDANGEGEASFRLDPYVADGTYDVKATYIETDNYATTNAATTVVVTPSTQLNIEISVNDVTSEDDVIINVSATDGSGATVPVDKVNVTIDGVTTEYPVSEDGTVNIGKLPAGDTQVTIGVDDGVHAPTSVTETISVKEPTPIDTVVTVTAVNITYGDSAVIEFTLADVDGNPITGTLNVTVGDINETVTVTGGSGKLTVPGLGGGNYTVIANYGGEGKLAPSTGSADFNVERKLTQIIYNDMVTTTMDATIDGRNGEYFYWTLEDELGNPIVGKPISIGFNGKIYNRTTDENGRAKLQINLARSDIYTFAIAFLGDEDYNGSFVVAKITTLVTKPTLTVPDKSYSASANTKTIGAYFKTNLGNSIPNRKVTFTVNGKTYSAATNADGYASVNVSISAKGTYTVTTNFAGDSTFNATSTTSKLKIT